MNKNFSFKLAMEDAFNFMESGAKTFFGAVVCVFILFWLAGAVIPRFLPTQTNPEMAAMIFKAVSFLMKAVIVPLSAMAFALVFYKKMKGDKATKQSVGSIVNLILFALAAYILPVIFLSVSMFLVSIMFTDGNITQGAFFALSLVLFILSVVYLGFFTISIFSPYGYIENNKLTYGFKKSISIVKGNFVKMFLVCLLFLIVLSIIMFVPNFLEIVMRNREVITPEFIRAISMIGTLISFILFLFLAFSVAVLTKIYLQLDDVKADA